MSEQPDVLEGQTSIEDVLETCPVRTYPATRLEPAEYCHQPLAPGSDLCEEHDAEEQAEAAAEDARYDLWRDERNGY